ncbi:membrane protein [Mycolicibacterium goodii]|uniref:Membrane protein n=1 Tax=Mycolicibacterium goodii TaxID=134601 RepID=A0A0K0XFD1_MYCGD|nr:membrane protein [Mycolicibacterium goodii]
MRPPRWPVLVRLRGRDPMVRAIDRVEALIFALVVVAAVLCVPVVGAIGTAVHDARSQHNAQLAASRTAVQATVIDVTTDPGDAFANTRTATGRWSVDGAEHSGVVPAPPNVEVGDTLQIWVDQSGAWVPAPPPASGAAADAITVSVLTLFGVAGVALTTMVLTRKCCDRVRFARWQHGIDAFIDHGDGHTSRS